MLYYMTEMIKGRLIYLYYTKNAIYHYIKPLTFRNILLFLTTLYETVYQKALDNNDTDTSSLCLCSFLPSFGFSGKD